MKRFVKIVLGAVSAVVLSTGGASALNVLETDLLKAGSLQVGKQGTGGVTYFNGTILNNTKTGTTDNPVTIGDNLRIDGRLYRGATAGTSDTSPLLINDNAEVAGALTVGGTMTVTGAATFAGKAPMATSRTEGSFPIDSDGDIVYSHPVDTSCTYGDTSIKYQHYHWKDIAVADLDFDDIHDIRVYTKPKSNNQAFPWSTSPWPNDNNVWISASVSFASGHVYLMSKSVNEFCSGTSIPIYFSNGGYQILVQS